MTEYINGHLGAGRMHREWQVVRMTKGHEESFGEDGHYGLNVSPQNSHVEILTS